MCGSGVAVEVVAAAGAVVRRRRREAVERQDLESARTATGGIPTPLVASSCASTSAPATPAARHVQPSDPSPSSRPPASRAVRRTSERNNTSTDGGRSSQRSAVTTKRPALVARATVSGGRRVRCRRAGRGRIPSMPRGPADLRGGRRGSGEHRRHVLPRRRREAEVGRQGSEHLEHWVRRWTSAMMSTGCSRRRMGRESIGGSRVAITTKQGGWSS
jgi:hypothetical protein